MPIGWSQYRDEKVFDGKVFDQCDEGFLNQTQTAICITGIICKKPNRITVELTETENLVHNNRIFQLKQIRC